MGNEYLEVGKVEGKRYQVIYTKDGEPEWDMGFDNIEEAVRISKKTLKGKDGGMVEICNVKTQKDVFVYDFDTGEVRETDMREEVVIKHHIKFTYIRKGEPFGNTRVKGHIGDKVEIQYDIKKGNLKKGMIGKIVAITNSKKAGRLQAFSDWYYKIEIEGKDHWISPGGSWEIIPEYKVVVIMDRGPEYRKYVSYKEARSRIVSLLQKGENGWNAKITGGGKSEFFERRGSGVVYQDGEIVEEEW